MKKLPVGLGHRHGRSGCFLGSGSHVEWKGLGIGYGESGVEKKARRLLMAKADRGTITHWCFTWSLNNMQASRRLLIMLRLQLLKYRVDLSYKNQTLQKIISSRYLAKNITCC